MKFCPLDRFLLLRSSSVVVVILVVVNRSSNSNRKVILKDHDVPKSLMLFSNEIIRNIQIQTILITLFSCVLFLILISGTVGIGLFEEIMIILSSLAVGFGHKNIRKSIITL